MRETLSDLIKEILKSISVYTFFPGRDTKEMLESLKTAFSVEEGSWKLKEDPQSGNALVTNTNLATYKISCK